MQVLLLPLRRTADRPSGYALEKQAALAELVALKRARRRATWLTPWRSLRRLMPPRTWPRLHRNRSRSLSR
ncbi:hypothetical protein KUV62_17185 [Salipiger bermudensis]|uniref:hypothetical protein n=1 Tax=Salipiger bermudensis TaxID=344736 RepID=UPI001C99D91E|nr:hypothetical protein [Salipiger bermudensis]MBY6005660.1 hypothetical protein [Salipiger bermudensis]